MVERVGAAQEQDTLVLSVKCDALVHADEADALIALGAIVEAPVGGIDSHTIEHGIDDILATGPLDNIRRTGLELRDGVSECQVE